jgi:citrate synthase
MGKSEFLTAIEAAEELGISLPTLYAYVSRGLIRSESEGKTRIHRYRRADVDSLRERQEQRKNPGKIAESALHWGAPVLESSISLITDGKLYYKGYDSTILSTGFSVEQVASLIWMGDIQAPFPKTRDIQISKRIKTVYRAIEDLPPMESFQAIIPIAAIEDHSAFDLRPSTVSQTGARILRLLATVATKNELSDKRIAEALQKRFVPGDPKAVSLFDAALVLSADHELNVSAFTARCVASAGSTPYAVVSAGLAALQGPKHGGHCHRMEALFKEAGSPKGARASLLSRLRRGEEIPGFGHTLYPEGDPRGDTLFRIINQVRPKHPAVRLAAALKSAMSELTGKHPTIDFGLVTICRALDLPDGMALGLFAMGRTIGWIGHAIEQYQIDRMIRPRARYVGLQPTTL